MTTGQPRRDAVQDRLAGQAGVEPLTLQGPGLSTPPAIRAPDLSNVQRIAGQLAEWGGGKIETVVNKQREKDMLAGQMAYTQGKTLEEINMAGNKWALEGYKLIDVQTTASSLMAAQREEIAQGDYQLSPEAYRNKYVARLDAALEGVDPETAKLVREQMASQMPTLVADHTTANMRFTEQQAYDALARSFDIVSRDPTATEALVVFAQGGEDSPSAGLSEARRKAATVEGVIAAFDNDNPMAYAALTQAGLLGDELSGDERNAIKAAQQRFETRRRTEYNEELFTGEQALMTKVENGELTPSAAVDELAVLYADHGIKMDRADAGAIYNNAENGERTANLTASLLIEEASMRGDYDTVASLAAKALPQQSGVPADASYLRYSNQNATRNDPLDPKLIDVMSFVGDMGITMDVISGGQESNKPGEGTGSERHNHGMSADVDFYKDGRKLDWNNPNDLPILQKIVRMARSRGATGIGAGDDYMGAGRFHIGFGAEGVWGAGGKGANAPAWLVEAYNSVPQGQYSGTGAVSMNKEEAAAWSGLVTKHKGNVQAAAVERQFGPGAVAEFLAGQGSEEVRKYAESVQAGLDNWRAPTAEDRLNIAQQKVTATRERLAMDAYEATEPGLYDLDNKFVRGEIDRTEWKAQRDAMYQEYGRAVTKADIDHEVATIKSATDYSLAQATKQGDEQYKLGLDAAKAELAIPRMAWEEVLNNPASTPEQITAANMQYVEARNGIFGKYGVQPLDQGAGAETEKIVTRTRDAMNKHKVWSEQEAEIGAAIAGGYVADLPKDMQERAFQKVQEDTIKTYTEAVGQGAMSEETANAAIARDMNAGFARMGVVDPKVARRMTAAVMGSLVDKEGNPNPMVVDAIAQWAELKAMNPRAADTMLSGEALVRAEAALAKSGGDPGMLADAVRDLGVDVNRSPLATDTDTFMGRSDVQQGIDAAVDALLATQDIGMFQAMFSDRADYSQTYDRGYTAADRMYSEENKTRVRGEMAEELARLQRQNPNIKASDLAQRAAENVERRTQFIGGDVVVLPVGQDFGKMFFGSRAAEFDHDGAVNSAVMEWLRSPGAQEQYGFLSGTTFAENLPGWMQGTIDAIPFVEFQPAMSWTEAGDTGDTGVRPFRAFVTANRTIAVEVLLPNGNYSEPIVVPADQAGKLYMQKKRGEIIQ